MNGEPTWISSFALRTLRATVVFLSASPRNQPDRLFSIFLPKSNKSKKTLAIQFGVLERMWANGDLLVASFIDPLWAAAQVLP